MRRRCVRSRRHCRHISRAVVARQVTHTRMGPFARRAEVLFAGVETDPQHPRTHCAPNIIGLVLALGHERLLGCCQSHARREDEGAAHRARTHALRRELSFTLVVTTRSTTGDVDARSGGVQPLSRWAALLRPPWNAACADVQPLTSKEQTVVSCGSPCTRKDCFRAAEPA